MIVLKVANLALRFLLELCLLAALGYWGFHAGSGAVMKVVLGVGAPVAMAVVWGTFMSPKAKVRLSRPLHLGAELLILGLGFAALYGAGQPRLAWVFAATSVLNRVLMAIWGSELVDDRREQAGGWGSGGQETT